MNILLFFITLLRKFIMMKSALHFVIGTSLVLASAAASAGTVTKPLNVSAIIQERVGPAPRCPSQFGGTITGSGDSALLGRAVMIATDCITPSGPLFNFSQGKMVIVTTTGEQIYANYSGQFVPTGVGAAYVFSGATFQITGGTGRYWRASGGGSINGGEDMQTGAGTAELAGKITYFGW
jgi:hypothetical protein